MAHLIASIRAGLPGTRMRSKTAFNRVQVPDRRRSAQVSFERAVNVYLTGNRLNLAPGLRQTGHFRRRRQIHRERIDRGLNEGVFPSVVVH